MMVKAAYCVAVLAVLAAASPAFSQMAERDVRSRLDAVYAGKADQVSREVPALLQQHPRDAGVLYIQAVLTTDGALAVKRYQEIAEKYPASVWADDALYKVYQYNYSLGLYKKADESMEQLRSRYPQSIYVTGAEKSATPAVTAAEQPAAVRPAVVPAETPAAATQPLPGAAEKRQEPAKNDVVEQTKPMQQTKTAAQQAAPAGRYYVQVGVFSTEENARKAIQKYGGMVGRMPGMTPKTSGGKTMYIVRFEGFDTAESARAFSTDLRMKHNLDSFVFANPSSTVR